MKGKAIDRRPKKKTRKAPFSLRSRAKTVQEAPGDVTRAYREAKRGSEARDDMKNRELIADIAVIVFMIAFLICVMFTAAYPEEIIRNSVFLTVMVLVMIMTYFTSVTAGLIANIALIFIYASCMIVLVLTGKTTVTPSAYFFMVMSPLMTVCTGFMFQKEGIFENRKLSQDRESDNNRYLDENTGFRLKNSMQQDVERYRAIARRGNINLMFTVWTFRYPAELKNLIGKRGMDEVEKKMAAKAAEAFRTEDILYLVSEYRWGALMLTPAPEKHAVIDRIREQLDMNYFASERAPRIDLRFGAAVDRPDANGVYPDMDRLIRLAEDAMQLDV